MIDNPSPNTQSINLIDNTFGCPSISTKIITIKSHNDLFDFSQSEWNQEALQFIGSGSNILLPPTFNRCVLLNQLNYPAPKIERLKHDKVLVTYPGCMAWHDCVKYSVINGFWGGENLALIPGKASTAPVQNIGAYGVELADLNPRIWGIDVTQPQQKHSKSIQKLTAEDAGFGYRTSIFNGELKNKFFITHIGLEFSLRPNPLLHYKDLQDYFKGQKNSPTLQKIMQAVVEVRQRKLPDPSVYPNAGSIFKNPIIAATDHPKLAELIPDLNAIEIDVDNHICYKLSAAKLIEFCGLKGYEGSDGVSVSEDHALVIINPQRASGDKVLEVITHVRTVVSDKVGIELEPEIEIV